VKEIIKFADYLSQFSGTLFENRMLAVFCSCFVFGFVIKMTRRLHNEMIPMSVVGWGMTMTMIVDTHHTPDLSLFAEKVVAAAVGMTIGFAAWFTHRYLWRPGLKKILKTRFVTNLIGEFEDSNQ
jgi:hypothetical protein